jgi:hypothetical protein
VTSHLFGRDGFSSLLPSKTMVIVHALSVFVEQLCARSTDAPSIEQVRPKVCPGCGEPARNALGALQLVGHGMYCRQVRGLSEELWIVIWVRRFLCLICGWLHPCRWYAATVIIEALCRHAIFGESSREIGARFGRPKDAMTWQSLFRWRRQLLVSPTLWGWLGLRLGVREPAKNRGRARSYLHRLLAEGRQQIRSGCEWLGQIPTAVRGTLHGLVYDRRKTGHDEHFPPGTRAGMNPGSSNRGLPTEKNSGPGPP